MPTHLGISIRELHNGFCYYNSIVRATVYDKLSHSEKRAINHYDWLVMCSIFQFQDTGDHKTSPCRVSKLSYGVNHPNCISKEMTDPCLRTAETPGAQSANNIISYGSRSVLESQSKQHSSTVAHTVHGNTGATQRQGYPTRFPIFPFQLPSSKTVLSQLTTSTSPFNTTGRPYAPLKSTQGVLILPTRTGTSKVWRLAAAAAIPHLIKKDKQSHSTIAFFSLPRERTPTERFPLIIPAY
ncbi:Uncharacterized protein HZ326_23751 [Fusarium oxysporum f. sp. albedinis]|nr:Uncharacterized protein HZ326_23751 [Fusarium oxysporum f. sp. albedinis]